MYPRRDRFLVGQFAWIVAALFVLVLLDSFSYELFFVISLIGLLVVTALTMPFRVTPTWQRRLRWVILVGLVGFAYVVIQRILEILPPGVF
ncbi:hypothetical protein [Salinigranum halophilum]|jgi:hypothetical protein|uniref:hypothetical protein n=1 Tax=Salinigranum halophilum TaxID=2565931 RepID=UPI0010A8A6B2